MLYLFRILRVSGFQNCKNLNPINSSDQKSDENRFCPKNPIEFSSTINLSQCTARFVEQKLLSIKKEVVWAQKF